MTPHYYYLGRALVGISYDQGLASVLAWRNELARRLRVPSHHIEIWNTERGGE